MITELQTFGIFVAGFIPLQLFLSYRARAKFDADTSGIIEPDEVPFLIRTIHLPVNVDRPSYTDMSLLSALRTLTESMLHAMCYGCTVVFLMNIIMLKFAMDQRYAYIMVTLMVFMTCMFLCRFATNGIHVATSHAIHFAYYGFAFFPSLLFLWNVPEQNYLVPLAGLFTLSIYMIGRCIALPGYPSADKTCRMYRYSPVDNQWILYSVPEARFGLEDTYTEVPPVPVTNEEGEVIEPSILHIAVVFPFYEIMNVFLSSSFGLGILIGIVANKLIVKPLGFETISTESIIIATLSAGAIAFAYQAKGIYGKIENEMHKTVFGKYPIEILSAIVAMLGAAAVTDQLAPPTEVESSTPVYYIGVGAVSLNVLLTFALSVWAKTYHKMHAVKNRRPQGQE